jgi:diguanylate cyclase (GGDEF)-like protein
LKYRDIQGCNIYHAFSLIEAQNLSPLLPALSALTGETERRAAAINVKRPASFKNAILKSHRGITLIVEGNISRLPVVAGRPPGYVLIFRNKTERKKSSAVVGVRPYRDILTGFSNREGLTLQLKKTLADLKNQDSKHTLLEVEIDRFNKIIDAAGMPGAKEFLRQFAMILRSQIQQEDIAARVSADTFIFMLRNCSIRDAMHVVGRINMAVSGYVFRYQDMELPLSVCIGMVSLSDGKKNVETLLRSAKTACARAKREEGNRVFCIT